MRFDKLNKLKWCGDGWINLFNVLIDNLTPFTNQYYHIQLGNKYIKFTCDGNNYLWSPDCTSSAQQPCHQIQGNDENRTSANFCLRFQHLADPRSSIYSEVNYVLHVVTKKGMTLVWILVIIEYLLIPVDTQTRDRRWNERGVRDGRFKGEKVTNCLAMTLKMFWRILWTMTRG